MSRYNMRLTEKGQCFNCLVKPLVYKRPSPHYFCSRCDREYDADGKFKPNWAWDDEYLPTDFGSKERKDQRAAELERRAKPQDPEQQAVKAWMENIGFVYHEAEKTYYMDNPRLYVQPQEATFFYRATQAQVAEARADERKIVEAEVANEYRLTREAKALTPDGLNGYWSALRDIQLNNKDRIAQLYPQKPKQETHK